MRSHKYNHQQPFKTKKAIASATVNFLLTQVGSIIDGNVEADDATVSNRIISNPSKLIARSRQRAGGISLSQLATPSAPRQAIAQIES